jgi:hypothetical protein
MNCDRTTGNDDRGGKQRMARPYLGGQAKLPKDKRPHNRNHKVEKKDSHG